ncbi:hypothetical protein Hanom_Chr00s000005g01611681 [Helianthus anomalus]
MKHFRRTKDDKQRKYVTPRFPRVSPVGPVGDYRDVVGNNIVKPHNYINAQRKLKYKYILQPLVAISNVLQKSNISTADYKKGNYKAMAGSRATSCAATPF